MKMLKKGQKGFTLIELLIVVAIIGILAAIAIPQFSAYRQRAYNGAANADVKNSRTAQESLFADYQTYGRSASGINLTGVTAALGGVAAGDISTGPLASATGTVTGLALAGLRNSDGLGVGIGTGLSNGVVFQSTNLGGGLTPAFGSTSYVEYGKHTQGTRVFATETEGTAIYYVENNAWGGTVLGLNGLPATGITNASGSAELVSGTTVGGGVPIGAWSAL